MLRHYASTGSAGLDLRACVEKPLVLESGESQLVSSGIAIHVADPGYEGVPPHLRLTVDQLAREAGEAGLVLDEASRRTEPMTWIGAPDEQLVELTRMRFRRRAR